MAAILIKGDSKKELYNISKKLSDIVYNQSNVKTYDEKDLPTGIFCFDYRTGKYLSLIDLFQRISDRLENLEKKIK